MLGGVPIGRLARLSPTALLLLLWLERHSKHGRWRGSLSYVAISIGRGYRTVQDAARELQDSGYITRARVGRSPVIKLESENGS